MLPESVAALFGEKNGINAFTLSTGHKTMSCSSYSEL